MSVKENHFSVIDHHCDLLSFLIEKPNNSPKDPISNCSFLQQKKGRVSYQTLAIFSRTEKGSTIKAQKQIFAFNNLLQEEQAHHFIQKPNNPLHIGMIPAIENASGLFEEDVMLNTEATISFLEKIEKAYPKKRTVHMFFDNARYYKNQAVKNFLKASKIQAHLLPPYSPNRNPIERLWKWMKERVLYNTYYQEFDDFKQAVFLLFRKCFEFGSSVCFRQGIFYPSERSFSSCGSSCSQFLKWSVYRMPLEAQALFEQTARAFPFL